MERKQVSVLLLITINFLLVHSLQTVPNELCDGVKSNSFVADPEDCTKFFQCNVDSVIHGTCPKGMYYHSIDVCSTDAADCESLTHPDLTTTSTDSSLTTLPATSTVNSPMDNATDPESFCLAADPNFPSFVKSPSDCSEYYICVDQKPILQKCTAGRYWNAALRYCDDPEKVSCEHDRILDPQDVCQRTTINDISFTASPTSCGEYYLCFQRKPFLMHCAPGSHWNFKTKQCDVAAVVKCKIQTTKVHLDSMCVGNNDKFLSHPAYCDLYVYCRNGKASTQRCPFLTDWDTVSVRCVPRYLAKCTKQRLH
ncbi:probable chitinase 10 [Anopheles maculipalpis]|uniref:probable chitinase 10 n=1 Tax=Anopheles maculipalpis TaxID=1496333 RepID=UPI002158E012|nr:probable chitinase 10 [Anopheles maculipalpis]